jgi:hypothetical protein
MKSLAPFFVLACTFPAFAETSRQLDAHEHGVGALNIAIDGNTVAMEFHAPGADIVGFEYEAQSDADLAAIDAAIEQLEAPLSLFALPADAACSLTDAHAALEGEEGHAHDEDGHEDHDKDEHADHDHDHDKEHEEHEEHADEDGHTEFHAEYALNCENPDALTEVTFAYFETFPNALEVEVQVITESGAQSFEVERDAPVLDLGALN